IHIFFSSPPFPPRSCISYRRPCGEKVGILLRFFVCLNFSLRNIFFLSIPKHLDFPGIDLKRKRRPVERSDTDLSYPSFCFKKHIKPFPRTLGEVNNRAG